MTAALVPNEKLSERIFRLAVEAAPSGMTVVDGAGRIALVNAEIERQFGYSRAELIGQSVDRLIPVRQRQQHAQHRAEFSANPKPRHMGTGRDFLAVRKDGTEFPVEVGLNPIRIDGHPFVVSIIVDISQRKKAEAILVQKTEELNRSNEELAQFANIASHDLQEPLRMVTSYTQLLSRQYKGKLDANADEFISFAVDGAIRMQQLIQDLLAYSRVGIGEIDLHDVSSEDSLKEALANLRGAIEDKGTLITHEPLPIVQANRSLLTQLFQNLVGNAIKYQGAGTPKVHISAAMNDKKEWTFSVQDNGIGIAPEYFDKIFGMFQRLHKRDEYSGTGIGLAHCRKIVERHGGNIWVESQLEQGSTFHFTLPTCDSVLWRH